MKIAALFLVYVTIVVSERKDYTGHRLISIRAETKDQLETIHGLESDHSYEELDFWTGLSTLRPIDVRVSPNDYGKLRNFLMDNGIPFSITNGNLQAAIDAEREDMAKKAPRNGICDPTATYCTFDGAVAYIHDMESKYPNNIQVSVIGNSHEQRPIYSVKIAENLNNPKPVIWIEVGTHPREWIAIASGLNLIQKLVNGDSTSIDMLAKYDWNIVPIHNPDGFVYTHESNRYHRKNRQPGTKNCNRNVGIDLNRNWDADFGNAGTSSICSEDLYGGASAFEALETAALRDAILADKNNVFAFFSIHAYSEMMLVPYAYTTNKPPRYNELFSVAENMMAWLETVRNTYYAVGTPPDIMSLVASGGAYDYMYLQGIPYSFTYELSPGPGNGLAGFAISSSYIPDVSEEVYRSLWGFADLNLTWP